MGGDRQNGGDVRPKGSFRQAARNYVNGPVGQRNDWVEACRAAGFEVTPPITGAQAQQFIGEERGERPKAIANRPNRKVPTEKAEIDLSGLAFPDPGDPEAEAKWAALAKQLMPTLIKIAEGRISATPTQRQVLQDIVNRGYGKAGAEKGPKESEADNPVVILPALFDGKATMLCPECLKRHNHPQGDQAQEGQKAQPEA